MSWLMVILAVLLVFPSVGVAEVCTPPQGPTILKDTEYSAAIRDIEKHLSSARALPAQNSSGFRIFAITPDSLWSKIGLCDDDVIQQIDNQPLQDPSGFLKLFPSTRRSSEVTQVKVLRGGEIISLSYSVDSDVGNPGIQSRAELCKTVVAHSVQKHLDRPPHGQSQDGSFSYAEFFNYGQVIGLNLFDIKAGSSAQKLGLRRGDVVISVGNVHICAANDISLVEKALSQAQPPTVVVMRKGQTVRLPQGDAT